MSVQSIRVGFVHRITHQIDKWFSLNFICATLVTTDYGSILRITD